MVPKDRIREHKMPKGSYFDRCYTLIRMFDNNIPVTAKKLQDKFDITRPAAYRMICEAELKMPIVPAGFDYSGGRRPSRVWKLME